MMNCRGDATAFIQATCEKEVECQGGMTVQACVQLMQSQSVATSYLKCLTDEALAIIAQCATEAACGETYENEVATCIQQRTGIQTSSEQSSL